MSFKYISPLTIAVVILIAASAVNILFDRSGGWGKVAATTFSVTAIVLLLTHSMLWYYFKNSWHCWLFEILAVLALIVYGWKNNLLNDLF